MIALIDCNNFYVSCERLFAPKLRNKAVVVLSNNDGCAISRSDEAKALGIKMGTPAFELKSFIQTGKISVFSSNYVLYGDISNRVVKTLSKFSPEIEVYSIDESFLNLEGVKDLENYALHIRKDVLQCTGIPTCVGVAKTKTLAKIANRFAKKNHKHTGVWVLDTQEKIEKALRETAIEDVWGVGNRYGKMLRSHNINTAFDFSQASENWVKSKMSVVGQRMLLELNGVPCLTLELITDPKKNICTSRSFGQLLTELAPLSEAVSNFASACAFKLRKQHSVSNYIQVFVTTNPFSKEKQYYNSITITLAVASNDSRVLIKNALIGLSKIYKDGFRYKKAGVIVSGIVPEDQYQLNLFSPSTDKRSMKLMAVMDSINHVNGRNKLRVAAQGFDRKWKLRNEKLSQRYTTRFDELLVINI